MKFNEIMRQNTIGSTIVLLAALALTGCGKAKLDESCTMNGLGKGSCIFTNTGTASGHMCGRIVVERTATPKKDAHSPVLCSGEVQKQSTQKVEFDIPAVHDMCNDGSGSWRDQCEFVWEEGVAK